MNEQKSNSQGQPKRNLIFRVLQQLATLVISLAICWYYLHDVKWEDLKEAISDVNLPLAIFGVALPNVAWWFTDSWLDRKVVRWFHSEVDYWGIFWIRGFTYLMMVIFPPLSEGGMAYYLYRKTGMSSKLISGIFIFKLVNMFFAVVVMMFVITIIAYAARFPIHDYINVYGWWALVGGGMFLLFFCWSYWIKKHNWGPISRLLPRESELWRPYNESTLSQWLTIWAFALVPYFLLYFGYSLAIHAFDVKPPRIIFILLAPVVLTLSDLPIFFGGLGGTTLAWGQFFPGSGAKEDIIAATLFIPVVRMIVRMVIGIVSLFPAPKDLALFWSRRHHQEDDITDGD
jgi:hypothetical protein